jgi:hypothetical protein
MDFVVSTQFPDALKNERLFLFEFANGNELCFAHLPNTREVPSIDQTLDALTIRRFDVTIYHDHNPDGDGSHLFLFNFTLDNELHSIVIHAFALRATVDDEVIGEVDVDSGHSSTEGESESEDSDNHPARGG